MGEVFNAVWYLVDRQVEAGNGDRIAVRAPSGTLTYAQLAAEVRRVAAGLRAVGVRPEGRVMLFMVDERELFVAILAAMRLGAVAVPVSTMFTAADLGGVLADSRARVLVASGEFVDLVRAAVPDAPDVRDVVLTGPDTSGLPSQVSARGWQELLAAGDGEDPELEEFATWPDSPGLWLYSSGTTGTPKAVMHRHEDVRVVCEAYASEVLGITADDVCFSVAKMFFAYGIGNSMFFPLSVGASTVLDPARPTPGSVAQRLAAERPTLFFGVPTFYAGLLASDVDAEVFSSVRQGASAGEPLPARIYERMRERFGVEVLDGIGSSEALHIFLSNRPGQVRPGSSGVPVRGYDVELRDEDGNLVADGQPGGLFLRGASIATGYWCRTEKTRSVFQGEWLATGDTYVRNDDGTYSCLGRSDDMLKAGGIWVSPAEVEHRLVQHDDVAEAVVVGVPDAEGLDKPVAVVVATPGCRVQESALIEFCRGGLASFKRPRRVVEVDELPKTATGKIQRFAVRELVVDRLGGTATS